jgi:hypothetical protein
MKRYKYTDSSGTRWRMEGSRPVSAFADSALAQQKRLKEKIKEELPPKEVRDWMKKHTEEVNKLNDGTLDKSTFGLGMIAMWRYLNKKIKDKQTNEKGKEKGTS